MKRSRFSDEQIIGNLKEHHAGMSPVGRAGSMVSSSRSSTTRGTCDYN